MRTSCPLGRRDSPGGRDDGVRFAGKQGPSRRTGGRWVSALRAGCTEAPRHRDGPFPAHMQGGTSEASAGCWGAWSTREHGLGGLGLLLGVRVEGAADLGRCLRGGGGCIELGTWAPGDGARGQPAVTGGRGAQSRPSLSPALQLGRALREAAPCCPGPSPRPPAGSHAASGDHPPGPRRGFCSARGLGSGSSSASGSLLRVCLRASPLPLRPSRSPALPPSLSLK